MNVSSLAHKFGSEMQERRYLGVAEEIGRAEGRRVMWPGERDERWNRVWSNWRRWAKRELCESATPRQNSAGATCN